MIDIRLGEDDGIELTRSLLDADPERRIVLYTGSSDEDLLFSGLDSGARGYALKDGSPRRAGRRAVRWSPTAAPTSTRACGRRCSRAGATRSGCRRCRTGSARCSTCSPRGSTGEQVAERLVLSSETIKTHIRNAMSKLEANTRVHAIAIALREGYISPPDDAEIATR